MIRSVLGGAVAAIVVFTVLGAVTGPIHATAEFVLWRLTLPRAILFLSAVALVAALGSLRTWRWPPPVDWQISSRAATLALGTIVGCAAALARALGSVTTLPVVLGDELIYANLAKSVARGDGFLLRGVENRGYGIGYPLFVAPFYALAGDGVSAYEALQVAQPLVMASAAVPVYLLARRALSRGPALFCAATSALVPAMVLSSLVLTEALFYPVALWFCVATVHALDSPTVGRQAAAVALLLVATSIRLQAVAAAAALVTAALLRSRVGAGRKEARRWLPTFALLGVAGLAWLGVVAATDVPPLGAYSVMTDAPDVGAAVVWTGRTLAALALAVGLVAMVAFVPGSLSLLRGSPRERSLGAVSVSMVVWLVLQVGYFSATEWGLDRVHERNLIVLVPIVVVTAMAWAAVGMPRPFGATVAGVVLTLGAVITLRRDDVLRMADLDLLSLVPWRSLDSALFPANQTALLAAAVAATVTVTTRVRWVVPLTVAVTMGVAAYVPTGALDRSDTRVLAWVDDEVGGSADVLVVAAGLPDESCHTRRLDRLATWTEFFNVAAVDAAHLFADNGHASLASDGLSIGADGVLTSDGRPVRSELIVIDDRVMLEGDRLASLSESAVLPPDAIGGEGGALSLWRLDGPARVTNAREVRALAARPECRQEAPDTS